GKPIPISVVLTIVAGAAAGLHHAHDRVGTDGVPLGIVHRDVSPSNLMVGFEGGVKVVDFGVAKAADRAQETKSGTVKGKISYLSPEQCRGRPVDRRSDLFSLGIVMWEMLTTERLFKRASDFENMTAIVNDISAPPSSRRANLPPELDAITLRLLAKDPAERFQTAAEVVDALEEAAARTATRISPSGLGRLLREMFGQRPEPWLELDAAEVPDGVTVTGQPVPAELSGSLGDPVDLQLSSVVDLSAAPSSSELPNILPATTVPTVPATRAAVASQAMTSMVASLPLPAPPPTHSGASRSMPRISHESGPQVAVGSAEHPSRAAASGSHPSISAHSIPAMPALPGIPVLQPPRRWPMVAVIGSATVIGSLTMWFAMKRNASEPAAPPAGSQAAIVMRAEPPVAPTPAPVAPTPAPAAVIDAGAAAPAVDASAAAPAIHASAASARTDAVAAGAAQPTVVDPSAAIALAITEQRYADAVAACSAQLPADSADACTLAACHTRLDTKARAWFARVANGRAKLAATCRGLGIELVVKRPASKPVAPGGVPDPCDVDPASCQH
ncbi:MAG: serine/threonine protein kinase, partial [Kofleriaceae bacterium]